MGLSSGERSHVIRLELFRGVHSLGMVSWEPPGWVRIWISDPETRGALLEALGGPSSKAGDEEEIRFKPSELTGDVFEATCLALAKDRGLLVAPRPSRG